AITVAMPGCLPDPDGVFVPELFQVPNKAKDRHRPPHALLKIRQHPVEVHPVGSEYLVAEATYRFGFSPITSSRWLQQIMRSRYGAAAARFTYAYDSAVYHANLTHTRPANRVVFYARTQTARRAVELGLLALERVAARV